MARISISNELARAMLDEWNTVLGASPLLRIYGGTRPALADDATGETLLAELPLSATPFQAATDDAPGASIDSNTVTNETSAPASGTATWGRIVKSGAGAGAGGVVDGDVGVTGEDININTTAITLGGVVSCSGITFNLLEST